MSARHGRRRGKWFTRVPFLCAELQEAAAAAKFNVDQLKTDTPTLQVNDYIEPVDFQKGWLQRAHYRINPVNAVTYAMILWEAAEADDYESNLLLIYETPAAQADDTDYDRAEMMVPFYLGAPGTIFYSIDWTGATGNVQGFILAGGEAI